MTVVKLGKKKLAIIISAAAVAVIAVTLAIVLPLTLKKSGGGEGTASQSAQNFVNFVMRINTPITADSEAEIAAGYVLYEHLNEDDRSNAAVSEQKAVLDGYKSEFDVLKAAKDEETAKAEQEKLRERFIAAVSVLPDTLKSDDREDIDAAFALYNLLNEQSKSDPNVSRSHSLLVQADEKVSRIEEEERLAAIAEAAESFIGAVEELDEITLDSVNALEDLLYDYENLEQDVKEFEGVPEAKRKLDAAMEEYLLLKDDDDIENFKALVKELSPVETAVTLESERTIIKAETLYEDMSDRAKQTEGIDGAHGILVAAREKYDELFAIAEAERIRVFIAAANAVRTDIENVAIDWFDALDAASDAYWSLSYDSQSLPEVVEAFERWDAAQMAFDNKGYKRIPMTNPNLLFSGHVTNALLVLQNENNMLAPLKDFYSVSSVSELSRYVIVWLNVYVDGVCVGKGELPASVLGHEIPANYIQDVLRGISADSDKVVSGGSFAFSINFEDRDNEFVPSAQTGVSPYKVYTW